MKQNERGGIAFNVLIALLVVIIGVLAYMLVRGGAPHIGRTIGTDATDAGPRTPQPVNSGHGATTDTFSDGLGRPDATTQYPLDEFGAGLAETNVFMRDINNDGRPDRITRRRTENGTAHFVYEYTIELNTGDGFTDITPQGFHTVEGAQCALQKLRFVFKPAFSVVKISRPWRDTWATPTEATRDTFSIRNDQIYHISSQPMPTVCDVSELF